MRQVFPILYPACAASGGLKDNMSHSAKQTHTVLCKWRFNFHITGQISKEYLCNSLFVHSLDDNPDS